MSKDNILIELSGTVDSVTYRSRESGYTVVKLKTGKEIIVVAGAMPYVSEGDSISVHGTYVIHPT